MDSLDQEIAEAFTEQPLPQGPGRILVLGGAPAFQAQLVSKLAERGHSCVRVDNPEDGLVETTRNPYDLVLLDSTRGDGYGLDLVAALQQAASSTKVIVLCRQKSFEQAVRALRCGVVDVVDVRTGLKEITERIDSALRASRVDTQREQRLDQLKEICTKLVEARREVSEHLDRLCQDLVSAYEDVSVQMTEVAMAAEFRTLLKQELDVEDLLRTALEYLLTKTGPTNAAVFLPDNNQSFELGAYVNYDCPRETITVLLNHLCRSVCPQMSNETDIVSFEDAAAFAEWIGAEAGFLAGCQVVAFSCRHEDRCMAVMVLFRSKDEPFDESLAPTIDILRAIFADQVAAVIRVHHRASPEWPKDPADEHDEYDASDYDDFGFGGLVA